ncbi:hypothetical protein LXA43DRAFT_1066208 [Ganoderma leucocontextum]|nr:hypothetical protein LXA43DRAFT_1066208 [Ganoderma leucocontextum]
MNVMESGLALGVTLYDTVARSEPRDESLSRGQVGHAKGALGARSARKGAQGAPARPRAEGALSFPPPPTPLHFLWLLHFGCHNWLSNLAYFVRIYWLLAAARAPPRLDLGQNFQSTSWQLCSRHLLAPPSSACKPQFDLELENSPPAPLQVHATYLRQFLSLSSALFCVIEYYGFLTCQYIFAISPPSDYSLLCLQLGSADLGAQWVNHTFQASPRPFLQALSFRRGVRCVCVYSYATMGLEILTALPQLVYRETGRIELGVVSRVLACITCTWVGRPNKRLDRSRAPIRTEARASRTNIGPTLGTTTFPSRAMPRGVASPDR